MVPQGRVMSGQVQPRVQGCVLPVPTCTLGPSYPAGPVGEMLGETSIQTTRPWFLTAWLHTPTRTGPQGGPSKLGWGQPLWVSFLGVAGPRFVIHSQAALPPWGQAATSEPPRRSGGFRVPAEPGARGRK